MDGRLRTCSVAGCEREYRARGFCNAHYTAARKAGELELVLPRRKDDLCATCRERQRQHAGTSYCRPCASADQLRRYRADPERPNARKREDRKNNPEKYRAKYLARYGLTTEQFDLMVIAQGGGCAICGARGDLHVDHDHACCPQKLRSCGNCVRGLLCMSCNNGLGRFRDDTVLLTGAATYLYRSLANREFAGVL